MKYDVIKNFKNGDSFHRKKKAKNLLGKHSKEIFKGKLSFYIVRFVFQQKLAQFFCMRKSEEFK